MPLSQYVEGDIAELNQQLSNVRTGLLKARKVKEVIEALSLLDPITLRFAEESQKGTRPYRYLSHGLRKIGIELGSFLRNLEDEDLINNVDIVLTFEYIVDSDLANPETCMLGS